MDSYCPQCKSLLDAGAAFCGNCAHQVLSSGAAVAEKTVRGLISGLASDAPPGTSSAPVNYSQLSGDPTFDPLANSRFQWQVARQVALFVGFFALAETAVGILSVILGIAGLGFSGAFHLWSVVGGLVWIVLIIFFWLQPIPALLAQWSRLVSYRAGAAPTALAEIKQAFDRHATPNDKLQPRSMSPPGEGRREYLELRRGVFSGIMSSFAHGEDLYMAWTFWIYMSPLRLMLMFIGRRIQNNTGRGNDMYQTLRYESTRATIAAIHNSVTEVADAIGGPVPAAEPEAEADSDADGIQSSVPEQIRVREFPG